MKAVAQFDIFPEVQRVKLFMFTMTQIKLYKNFKARKWYYVSKNKMTVLSFPRLQKNVENQKLPYNINNYKKARTARLVPLFIGAGILALLGTMSW